MSNINVERLKPVQFTGKDGIPRDPEWVKQNIVCKYYKTKTCRLGNSCRFLHAMRDDAATSGGETGIDGSSNSSSQNRGGNNGGGAARRTPMGGQHFDSSSSSGGGGGALIDVGLEHVPLGGVQRRPLLHMLVLFASDAKVLAYAKTVMRTFMSYGMDVYLQRDCGQPGQQIKTHHLSEMISASRSDYLVVIGDRNMKNGTCQSRAKGKLTEVPLRDLVEKVQRQWVQNSAIAEAEKLNKRPPAWLVEKYGGVRHVEDRLRRCEEVVERLPAQADDGGGKRSNVVGGDQRLASALTTAQKSLIKLHKQLLTARKEVMANGSAMGGSPTQGVAVDASYHLPPSRTVLSEPVQQKVLTWIDEHVERAEQAGAAMSAHGAPLWDSYREAPDAGDAVSAVVPMSNGNTRGGGARASSSASTTPTTSAAAAAAAAATAAAAAVSSSRGGGGGGAPVSAAPLSGWLCSACTFANPPGGEDAKCEMCETPRPADEWSLAGEAGKEQRRLQREQDRKESARREATARIEAQQKAREALRLQRQERVKQAALEAQRAAAQAEEAAARERERRAEAQAAAQAAAAANAPAPQQQQQQYGGMPGLGISNLVPNAVPVPQQQPPQQQQHLQKPPQQQAASLMQAPHHFRQQDSQPQPFSSFGSLPPSVLHPHQQPQQQPQQQQQQQPFSHLSHGSSAGAPLFSGNAGVGNWQLEQQQQQHHHQHQHHQHQHQHQHQQHRHPHQQQQPPQFAGSPVESWAAQSAPPLWMQQSGPPLRSSGPPPGLEDAPPARGGVGMAPMLHQQLQQPPPPQQHYHHQSGGGVPHFGQPQAAPYVQSVGANDFAAPPNSATGGASASDSGSEDPNFIAKRDAARRQVMAKYRNAMPPERQCCYCGEESSLECNWCAKIGRATYFCSAQHQALMWKQHMAMHEAERPQFSANNPYSY